MAIPAYTQQSGNTCHLLLLQKPHRTRAGARRHALLFLLVVFVLVAFWQTLQLRQLAACTRSLREDTAQVQLAHDVLEVKFLARGAVG